MTFFYGAGATSVINTASITAMAPLVVSELLGGLQKSRLRGLLGHRWDSRSSR